MPARVKCAVLAWHTLKEALGSKLRDVLLLTSLFNYLNKILDHI